jgi:hypothetical protein
MSSKPDGGASRPPDGPLDRRLCQVGGVNHNVVSASGSVYHVQVEDRGPVLDPVAEREVRRLNVIIYANYGEPRARIIHGRDHDFEDQRTPAHNRYIEEQVQRLALEARDVIQQWEDRTVMRIKALIRQYYDTRSEDVKREFEDANASFPFLFSRAWADLKAQKMALPVPALEPASAAEEAPEGTEEILYPLDEDLRGLVMELERIIIELGHDLHRLREQGHVDDILMQTCRKLVSRAKESLSGKEATEFNARRLEMTRNSLMTTWKQVRSRVKT